MSLERLPNELLLLIFSYLHKLDLIHAFSDLNHRFEQIVKSFRRHIDLSPNSAVNYRQFRLLYKHILPSHRHEIRSFKLAGYQQVQLFTPYIHQLTSLESLDITGIAQDEFRNGHDSDAHHVLDILPFVKQALALPCLHKLSVDLAADDILPTIAASPAGPNLTELVLIYPRPDGLKFQWALRTMPAMQHFTANFHSIRSLARLLTRMPNLRVLKASMMSFDDPEAVDQLTAPDTLEALWLEFGCFHCCTSFQSLKAFLAPFKDHVRSLTLISVNVDKDLSDYDKFHSLVDNFARLETFRYCIRTEHRPDSLLRFVHVREQPDSSWSFYTLPPPQKFDVQSEGTRGGQYTGGDLTWSKLFSCRSLWAYGSEIPMTFELSKNVTLDHLHIIELPSPFGKEKAALRQYLSQVISLSPNLHVLDVGSEEDSALLINVFHELFPSKANRSISHLRVSLCWNNHSSYYHSSFWAELAEVVPNLQTIQLWLEQHDQDEHFSLIELITDLRRHFKKLLHLLIGSWSSNDAGPNTLEYSRRYINKLKRYRRESIEYSLEYRYDGRGDGTHFVNIWV